MKSKCECIKDLRCLLHWNEQKDRIKIEKDEKLSTKFQVNNIALNIDFVIDNFTFKSFSIQRRFIRRVIDESQSLKFLKKWNKIQKIEIERDISNSKRLKFLQLTWIYRDDIVLNIAKVSITNFIVHRIHSRSNLKS